MILQTVGLFGVIFRAESVLKSSPVSVRGAQTQRTETLGVKIRDLFEKV